MKKHKYVAGKIKKPQLGKKARTDDCNCHSRDFCYYIIKTKYELEPWNLYFKMALIGMTPVGFSERYWNED